ncbi:MAG: hypothetical protein AAF902_13135 [Chloroflexota bacterium]
MTIFDSPIRPRRLRHTPTLRRMVRETELTSADFIYLLFTVHGEGERNLIVSMPGISQLSVDEAVIEVKKAWGLGVAYLKLFSTPAEKDPICEENYAADGIFQQATRAIKAALP